MGTWACNTTTGAWTLSGSSVSTVEILGLTPTSPFAVVLQVLRPEDNVGATVPMSLDGQTRWESIVDATNVTIYKRAFGDTRTTVTTGAGDIPASGPAQIAHGLPIGVPYESQTRFFDGVIEIWINGVRKVRVTIPDDDYFVTSNAYGRLRYYGFCSDTTGAVIQKATLATLERKPLSFQTEALVAVCDGDVWLARDETAISKIASKVFNRSGPVSLEVHNQRVYGLDGVNVRVIDPKVPSVDPVGGTTAETSFPGATEITPGVFQTGTTRMTIIAAFLDRLAVAGDPQDPQNVYLSATGEPENYDVGAEPPGQAFALSAAYPGRIGEPVTALAQSSKGVLVIGNPNQIWQLTGDPAVVAFPDVSPLSLNIGISGKDAMTLVSDGALLAHSPSDGLLRIQSQVGGVSEPTSISASILSQTIVFPVANRDDYLTQVIRDPSRDSTHIFLTPKESGAAVHFCYSERVGSFEPGMGGFFPDRFHDSVGPTASCLWRGDLILGTRYGALLKFGTTTPSSDDGTVFTSQMPLTILDLPGTDNDTILHKAKVTLALDSDPIEFRVYGGRSVEDVLTGSGRSLLSTSIVRPNDGSLLLGGRSPGVSVEIWNTTLGRSWALEAVEVWISTGRVMRRAAIQNPTIPGYCQPNPAEATGDGDTGPGDGADPPPDDQFVWMTPGSDVAIIFPSDVMSTNIADQQDPAGPGTHGVPGDIGSSVSGHGF